MSSDDTSRSLTSNAATDPATSVESSQQLALSLFEQLATVGAGVDQVPTPVGFQRNNVFVEIEDLSVTARRALDVMYFIAAEDPEIRESYQVDLNYFKWLMAYGSNNRAHLRKVLREGQKGAIQLDQLDENTAPNDRFVSVPLLGLFGFNNGKVTYELNIPLQKAIKNPESSHFLSLRYVFKNLYAKILYDKLLPHLHVGVTPWVSIETLRQWFCLEPDSYTEFKRLSERTIKPSVKQINEVTGLNVSFTTRNVPGSKRVSDISFQIRSQRNPQELKAPMLVLKELYHILRDEFGLSAAQLMEIINNREEYNDDRLYRAIEYTRFHISQGKVKLPPAYLMKAIRSDFTLGKAMVTVANQKAEVIEARMDGETKLAAIVEQNKNVEETRRKSEASIGFETFLDMSAQDQHEVLSAFTASGAAKVIAMRLRIEPEDLKEMYQDNVEIQEHLGSFIAQQARKQSRRKARQGQQPSLT